MKWGPTKESNVISDYNVYYYDPFLETDTSVIVGAYDAKQAIQIVVAGNPDLQISRQGNRYARGL
ncbi:MAG TPA: hypothetical protein VFC84_16090 [Desulfosporosinus sp.]|nr:hypothetical protein [Desulfosporosinus sp.]